MWTNHLTGQQAVKAAAKERLTKLNEPLQQITDQMGKLEAKHDRVVGFPVLGNRRVQLRQPLQGRQLVQNKPHLA